MPGGDGSGPMGMGPMTGRAAGYCAGNAMPTRGRGPGRGFGLGFRGGWRRSDGYGMPYVAAPTPEQEVGSLEAQAQSLASSLESIKRRIEELKPSRSTE